MKQKISEKLGLGILNHKDIEFVNVCYPPDTKLFIDPILIKNGNTEFCIKAREIINSFFDEMYNLYSNNVEENLKLEQFKHSNELNSTKLGYGSGINGHGRTSEGMVELFKNVDKMIQRGLQLNTPEILRVFVKGFAEDCMSDLLTNILYKELSIFTSDICKNYGLNDLLVKREIHFWNHLTNSWGYETRDLLVINGEVITLVPKILVKMKYSYTLNHFFTIELITRLQDEILRQNPGSKKQSKKSLKRKILQSKSKLDAAIDMTVKYNNSFEDYRVAKFSSSDYKQLDDDLLDILTSCK